tara:strand:- start:213 stop:680 length:468 start_codon:yes stop_codon:yes gene_type:complete
MHEDNKNIETKNSDNRSIRDILDTAGFLSGPLEPVGMGADLLSGLISLQQGDYGRAGLSGLALVPGLGLMAGTTKKAKIRVDRSGNIVKDKEFSDSFDALAKEVEERQVAELSKRSRTEMIRDEGLERRQAERIIKKLRESKTFQDIREILLRSD